MFTAYRRFKKNTSLRRYASPELVRAIKRAELAALGVGRVLRPVRHRSRFKAVAHVGLQKTGSVWFREMFSDLDFYRYSGLIFRDQAERGEIARLPLEGAYSPIRRFEPEMAETLMSEGVAVLGVVRDPVAMVLSWIKSTSKYHVTKRGEEMFRRREDLLACETQNEQIAYAVSYFAEKDRFGQYERLLAFCETWPDAIVVKYEDCISEVDATFARIFGALDIRMPEDIRAAFLRRHSFNAYSGREITQSGASEGSSLQGQTHLEAEALSEEARARIVAALPPRIRQYYCYDS